MQELWFYVPDYVEVRQELEDAYALFGITEHSAEAGRVPCFPNDADVVVGGRPADLADFKEWLLEWALDGLMIEGREIERQ